MPIRAIYDRGKASPKGVCGSFADAGGRPESPPIRSVRIARDYPFSYTVGSAFLQGNALVPIGYDMRGETQRRTGYLAYAAIAAIKIA